MASVFPFVVQTIIVSGPLSRGQIKEAEKPRPSPFTLLFGSFDAWVEREVLPGIQSGALDRRDMVAVVAALRAWNATGHGSKHMLADGEPAWLVAWRERDHQQPVSPKPERPPITYAPRDTFSFPAKSGVDWQGMIVPKRWEYDGCVRREPVLDADTNRRVWSGR